MEECPAHVGLRQGTRVHVEEDVLWRADGSQVLVEYWSYPLLRGNEVVGAVVTLLDISERKAAAERLQGVHDRLNSALHESEARARENVELSKLGDLLQCCDSVEQACNIGAPALAPLFASRPGALSIVSPSKDAVETAAIWSDCASTERLFGPEDCWALRRGKIHVVDSVSAARCAHVKPSYTGAYICVPLAAQGETLGVLYVEDGPLAQDPGLQPQSLEPLACAVGERMSLALANLKLREILRNQSIRDPLTGLFNRRFMEESLVRELRRAARKDRNVALVMIDLDHFKKFNDTFGHQAGDTVLREIAGVMGSRVRAGDIACRYGGEEFALILSETDAQGATRCVQQIREAIRRVRIEYRGQALGTVTVSAGIAVFPAHADNAEDLVRAGDQALYRCKAQGRDCVLVAAVPALGPVHRV